VNTEHGTAHNPKRQRGQRKGGGELMTDSRLPDRWLMNPIMRELSDTDWRVYTWALMQSNNQQTDGYIPASALVLLHPDGKQPESYERLCAVGLWEQVPSGYQAIDWGDSQTLSSDLQRRRKGSRNRQQNKRDRDATRADNPAIPVTRDVTRDVQGKERQGKARIGEDRQEPGTSSLDTYDPVTGKISGWNTATVPNKDHEDGDTF